jgi:hypothetical protein
MRAVPAQPNLRIFYLLSIAVGAIGAHLAAEFAAMGSEADSVVFSARHWYLGLAVVVGICVFIVSATALLQSCENGRDLKRMLSVGLDSLPFHAKGPRYYILTAGLQLAIGMATQIGEGCPFCGHDVTAGVLGAVATTVLVSLVTRWVGSRLTCLAGLLVRHLRRAPATAPTVLAQPARNCSRLDVWFPLMFNRPPPALQVTL